MSNICRFTAAASRDIENIIDYIADNSREADAKQNHIIAKAIAILDDVLTRMEAHQLKKRHSCGRSIRGNFLTGTHFSSTRTSRQLLYDNRQK